MLRVVIKDRGSVPRRLVKAINAAKKQAWYETAVDFHSTMRDARFTEEHARAAGYTKRKGEGLPTGSSAWRRSYTGKKFSMYGHTRPLEFSGETRRAARQAAITATSKGARITYRGLRKLNFRHPKSQIRMGEEFRRLTRLEVDTLAKRYDDRLDRAMKSEDK